MGDTYDKSKVRDSKISETRFQRMTLFLEFAETWGDKKRIAIGEKLDKYIHLLRLIDIATEEWEGHTKFLSSKIDKSTEIVTKHLQTNKHQTHSGAKKMTGAIESMNEDVQEMKADHERRIGALTEGFTKILKEQNKEFKIQNDSLTQQNDELKKQLEEQTDKLQNKLEGHQKQQENILEDLKEMKAQNEELTKQLSAFLSEALSKKIQVVFTSE